MSNYIQFMAPKMRPLGIPDLIADARMRMDAGAAPNDAWTGSGLYTALRGIPTEELDTDDKLVSVMNNPEPYIKRVLAYEMQTPMEKFAAADRTDSMGFSKRPAGANVVPGMRRRR